jgi:hypothetical protein
MPETTTQPQTEQSKAYIESLIKLCGFLRTVREPYEPLMQDVCEFAAPELRKDGVSKGLAFGRDLSDGYSMIGLDSWSKGIPGNMVYEDTQWLNMRINVRQLAESKQIREYCQKKSESVFWAARRSNFRAVQVDLARHAGTIGGYLIPTIDYHAGAVEFVLCDPWKVWVARDGMGKVMYFMRRLDQTLASWAKDFGKDKLPADWRKDMESNPFASKTISHLIFENPEYDSLSGDVNARRWANVYLDEAAKRIIHQDTLDYGVISWGTRVPPGWDYPATPSMYAYVDSLTNNTLTETLVRAARVAADPPMKASSRLRGSRDFDVDYGGVTWIERPEDIVEQIAKIGQYPAGDNERDRIRYNIDRWYSVHYFEILSRMEGNPPTAYHIRKLESEKATLLGPEVGSYKRDVLDPGVDVMIREEPNLSGDTIPEPEELVAWVRERAEVSLERMGLPFTEENYNAFTRQRPLASLEATYNGALSVIETEMAQNRRYMDGLALLGAAMEIWPEAPLIGKADSVMRNALQAYNWTENDLRDKEEFKQALDALNQRQQMQEQAAMMKDLAGTFQQTAQAEKVERT